MPYFKNWPKTPYQFGDEDYKVLFPNLVAYGDIIDNIKNSGTVYQKIMIQRDERPDQLSQRLYGSPEYHWTFYLMNDRIREQGWPATQEGLDHKIEESFPNTVLVTRNTIYDAFLVGATVEGLSSGETGTIIRRDVNLGHIWIEGVKNFIDGEILVSTVNEVTDTITLHSSVAETDAPMYYKDSTGMVTDIDPTIGPGGSLLPYTYRDHYIDNNENIREIRVIKPDLISQIAGQYRKVMK